MNSTLSFADKYRPKNLQECIGLGTQADDITNMLLSKNLPNFIMLTGGSGLGKSTIERIIAKSIYCENFKKHKKPCEKCDSCIEFNKYIETGNSDNIPYVYDINASKDNGKASADAIIEDSEYPAPMGEYKIFIVDEAHKLTDGAQNAILKPLEDSLPRVCFIMGTTDPEMLLNTIHSRVKFKIHLNPPTKEEVVVLLKRICDAEQVKYHEKALELVSEKALESSAGGTRSCVNELNQIILSKGNALYSSIEEYYEAMPTKIFFEYTSSLLHGRIEENITLIHHIKETVNLNIFIKELISFMKRGVYLYNDIEVTSVTSSELPKYKELFKKFSILELSIAMNSLRTIQRSNDIEADLMVLAFDGLKRENTTKIENNKTEFIKEDVVNELRHEKEVHSKVVEKQKISRVEESKKVAEQLLTEDISFEEMVSGTSMLDD